MIIPSHGKDGKVGTIVMPTHHHCSIGHASGGLRSIQEKGDIRRCRTTIASHRSPALTFDLSEQYQANVHADALAGMVRSARARLTSC